MFVTSIMTREVKTAYSDQTIREVCKSMHDHRIGSIVILRPKKDKRTMDKPENHMTVGIVTERDVVSYLGSDRALSLRTQISKIMSTPLITIGTTNSLKDAIEIMQLRDIRRLPVMNSKNDYDNMVGIITDKDILRTIMKTMPLAAFAGEGPVTDQMQLGYRFLYDRYINEDNVPKSTDPRI